MLCECYNQVDKADYYNDLSSKFEQKLGNNLKSLSNQTPKADENERKIKLKTKKKVKQK